MKTCKNLILWNFLLLILLASFSCKKEEERIMMVRNDSITNISYTSAKAYATIIDQGEGIEQHGHCWSTSSEAISVDNDTKTENGPGNTTGSYNSDISGLSQNTSYFVKAYIMKGANVVYGNKVLSFHTLSLSTPDVTTDSVTNITTTSATVSATLNNLGAGGSSVTQHGHCWSNETATPTINDDNKSSLGERDSTGSYESYLVGLYVNTRYYVRAYATNDAGTSYGDTISFITNAELPVISTLGITSITDSSAQGGGDISDDGGATVTARGVCWSTSENPDLSDSYTEDGSGTGSFASNITGLLPATTYYVRAYATNRGGTAYGNQVSFTTSTAIPKVITASLSWISETSAQSGGNITSDGGAAVTARGVCWSTSENPTILDNYTTDGSGTGSFTSYITGLSPGTTYYVRAYATNSIGTAYGNELVLTTLYVQISWQKSLGGSYDDWSSAIYQTTDGGYIIAGSSDSNDGDVSVNHGNTDYWIVKLTSAGDIDWQKSYGGTDSDYGLSIQQTTDGGYIVAGNSFSNDGDVSGNHGLADYWIVKLTSTGDISWQKSLGGSDSEWIHSIQQTTDGSYIVAGVCNSNDGDVSGNHGNEDFWIVKLTSSGDIDWQKSIGGSSDEWAKSIQQTTDGGYIVTGYSYSNDGDITENQGYEDLWIVKLTSTGEIDWQKSLGGSSGDQANSIQQTTDGGYIIAGWSWSNDGDVSGNHGNIDYWIVKLTSTVNIEWQKSLGGSDDDYANSIQQTADGGYIIAGYSRSTDGDISGNHGDYDYWIVKLTSTGEIIWQKSLGGSSPDYGYSIQQTTDGKYIVSGNSASDDGDVSGNKGSCDFWIVKISEN